MLPQSVEGLIASTVEDMWPGIITGKTQRRTAMAQKVGPCAACVPSRVYNNTFFWTIPSGGSHRSGSSIWHDNTWLGRNSANGTSHRLVLLPGNGAAGNELTSWGIADGANGWDKNDPHGLYFSGTAASNTTTRQPRNIYRYRNDSPGRL